MSLSWLAVSCSGTSEALKSLDESLNTQTGTETQNSKTGEKLQVRLTTIKDGQTCPAGGVKIEVIQVGETGQADSVITEQIECGSEAGRWTWVKTSDCNPSQPDSCREEESDPGEPVNVPAPSIAPPPLPACTSNGQSDCVAQTPYVAADLRSLVPENIKNGVAVAGVAGTFSDRPPDCLENGQENCVATGLFKAADLSALVPTNIRYGRTIAGVTGIYPSPLSPLEGSSGADLPSFSANVPAGQYQCFKSDGSRVAGSISDVGVLTPGATDRDFSQSLYRGFLLAGDSDLQADYILSGVNIFGVSGNVVLPPKANVQEGTFFGPGLNSLEGEITVCEAAGSVGCLTSTALKPYEPCTYDGQVSCAANSTYQAWAPITAVASASVTDADENESITFAIATSNIPDGGSLFYTISGTGITSGDFANGVLSGFATVTNNQATVTVPLREDFQEEGEETVVLTAYRMMNAASAIINDTSTAYLPDPSLTRAWYDASNTASLTLAGSLVTEWRDLGPSGYHLTQADPTERPTYFGSGWNSGPLPYLDWGATNNTKSLDNVTTNIGVQEVFVVAQFEGTSFTNYHGLVNHTGTSESGLVLLTNQSGSNIYAGGSFYTNVFLNGASSTSMVLLPTISNPFVVHTRVNAAVSLSGLIIGGDRTPYNSGRGWRGKIAEVMLYGETLSMDMRAKTEGYLAWKWGIQGSLNASHPYKSARP